MKQQENLHLGLQGNTGSVPSVKHCSKKRYFHHPMEETHTLDRRKGGNFFRTSEKKFKPGLPAPCSKVKSMGHSDTSYLDLHPHYCHCKDLEINLKNTGFLFSRSRSEQVMYSDRIYSCEKTMSCPSNWPLWVAH